MERVLITGITGYIGSHLARALLPDCQVYGLVRRPLHTAYISDIQDRLQLLAYDGSYESMEAALRAARPGLVYHLAACYTGGHGAAETPKLVDANITLGAYLLEAMTACGVPALVYASSVMAYYGGAAYRPLNLYAAAKQAFSDLLYFYTDAGFLRAVTLVLSDTYGPGDNRPKILNLVKHAARAGTPLDLSDGEQDYDVVYIDDVVRAFRSAGEQLLRRPDWVMETYQACADRPLTLRKTVDAMLRAGGLSAALQWGRRPAPEREIRHAVRKFPQLPGWTPETALEVGLKKIWLDLS